MEISNYTLNGDLIELKNHGLLKFIGKYTYVFSSKYKENNAYS